MIPIIYEVERLRDGKSYSTRRVTAIQHGNAIFSMIVSFHVEEAGAFDHQDKMPDVPPPEKLTAEEVAKQPMFQRDAGIHPALLSKCDRPIELRPVELGRYFGQKIDDGRIHVWIRTAAKLPDDPALHMCALAYASDFSLLDAVDGALRPHPVRQAHDAGEPRSRDVVSPPVPRRRMAALLPRTRPSAQGGRGLTRGSIFKPDGTLVASVAQEGWVAGTQGVINDCALRDLSRPGGPSPLIPGQTVMSFPCLEPAEVGWRSAGRIKSQLRRRPACVSGKASALASSPFRK